MLRFLQKYENKLTREQIQEYENKLHILLNIMTEEDESKATPHRTVLKKPHDNFLAYNVFKSKRVQELFFGILIFIDAFLWFKDEKYYEYAIGATDCLIDYYQKSDGRIEIDWGDKKEDYSTVCCAMISILDMANLVKFKDSFRYKKYSSSASKLANYVFERGTSFPTEGIVSDLAETEMEDGSISCTALTLLYYCQYGEYVSKYVDKAKEILDVHEAWVIKSPICQMHGSSLRWWETQWEGNADGPAICAGHAWTIWRAEADFLYYKLTSDEGYLIKAKNGFMTNLSKIDSEGKSYAIYNPDEINGGGFHSDSSEIKFEIAKRFADIEDCGMSRYVWIRLADAFLKYLK